jgi:hypothetical protein
MELPQEVRQGLEEHVRYLTTQIESSQRQLNRLGGALENINERGLDEDSSIVKIGMVYPTRDRIETYQEVLERLYELFPEIKPKADSEE